MQMHDTHGQQVWAAELDSYGRVRRQEGETLACPFRYQGQYEDVETCLYYNRFRYYDPKAGQYLSQDPIGLLGGTPNVYSYVHDPNVKVDTLGLTSLVPGSPLPDGTKLFRIGGSDISNLTFNRAELDAISKGTW